MSERIAVDFKGVGKMYRLYKSRLESFLDITSLGRMVPWWDPEIQNFWALRNVSFKLKAGSRLGIIGRNGAGKSTLLKLMIGNVLPTEGHIEVHGEVQALLEAGAGFHPEFTGYENVQASLTQNGLSPSEIKTAIDEIAEFTELGDFLGQPFKSYSAGMQARLVFTTATTIKPDILIIDEILGAGDAYFAAKSRSRMKDLVVSGASILLVSHSLDQVLQFCEETIWLERGRIVLRGPSLEVVKAYTEFVHTLQNRQLNAANRRRKLGFRDAVEVGHFAETFIFALVLKGPPGTRIDIGKVDFMCDRFAEETVRVGDPQDSDQTHFAYVALNTGNWGDPEVSEGGCLRSLTTRRNEALAVGEMVFRTYTLEKGKQYSFRVRYRALDGGDLRVSVSRNSSATITNLPVPTGTTGWQEFDVSLPLDDLLAVQGEIVSAAEADDAEDNQMATAAAEEHANASAAKVDVSSTGSKATVRRWPGEGSLLVDDVILSDSQGQERAVYQVGNPLTLRLQYRAQKSGDFPVIFTVAIYRLDGIKVTQHVSAREMVHMTAGEKRSVRLEFPSVDLADGHYAVSVSLHRDLDPQFPEETVRYDLLTYSYEFEIVGNPPLRTSLVVLPAEWKL